MNDRLVCDTNQANIQPSSSSLARAPSWSLGVGAKDDQESKLKDCQESGSAQDALDSCRVSLNERPNSAPNSPQFSLNIPTVYLTKNEPNSSSYHIYQVNVKTSQGSEWSVYRRYSQFYALHQKLKAKDSTISKIRLPPKRRLNSKASTIVQDRRRKLEEYLRCLSSYLDLLSTGNITQIESDLAARTTSLSEPNSLSDCSSEQMNSEHLDLPQTSADELNSNSQVDAIISPSPTQSQTEIQALFVAFISPNAESEQFNPETLNC